MVKKRGSGNFRKSNNILYWICGVLILIIALVFLYMILVSNNQPSLQPADTGFTTTNVDEYEGLPAGFVPTIGYYTPGTYDSSGNLLKGNKIFLWGSDGKYYSGNGLTWNGPYNSPLPNNAIPILGYYSPIGSGSTANSGAGVTLWTADGHAYKNSGSGWVDATPANINLYLPGNLPPGFKPDVEYFYKGINGVYHLILWDKDVGENRNIYYDYSSNPNLPSSQTNKWSTSALSPVGTGNDGRLPAGFTPKIGYFYNLNWEEDEIVVAINPPEVTESMIKHTLDYLNSLKLNYVQLDNNDKNNLLNQIATKANLRTGVKSTITLSTIPTQTLNCAASTLCNTNEIAPDVNGDNIIDEKDIKAVIDGALGNYNNDPKKTCLDFPFNGVKDGKIDSYDVQTVINYALGVALPVNINSSEMQLWYNINGVPYSLVNRMNMCIPESDRFEWTPIGSAGEQYGLGLPSDKTPKIGYIDPLRRAIVLWYDNEAYESHDGRAFVKTRGTIITPPDCVDSDNGKNYNVKGSIYGLDISNLINNKEDVCIDDTLGTNAYSGESLREYYCQDNKVMFEVNDCGEGTCNNGACGPAGVCTSGKIKCTNVGGIGYLQSCGSDLIWEKPIACAGDKSCTDSYHNNEGICAVPDTCDTENEKRCLGTIPQTCSVFISGSETSKLWTSGQDCALSGLTCNQGICSGEGNLGKCAIIPNVVLTELPAKTRIRIGEGANSVVKYCDPDTLTYKSVLSINDNCLNDYECNSNTCIEGKCKSISTQLAEQAGILKKIWCWITNLGLTPGYTACLNSP